MTGRLHRAAPLIDLACLVLFVLVGRKSHGIDTGVGWFLGVLWPLVVGWFVAALVTRLYTNTSRPWLRLVGTWGAGMALALVVRAGFGHELISTFTIVLFGFVGLETFGWRGLTVLFRRIVPARA